VSNQEYAPSGYNSNLPYGVFAGMSSPASYITMQAVAVDSHGLPNKFLFNRLNFDCTKRPWYVTAAARQIPTWTPPFLQSNNLPGISYVIPLQNMSYAGKTGFIGVLSFNLQLNEISHFLWEAYRNTSNSVYVVEKSTGYLIGNSFRSPIYHTLSSGSVVRI